MSKREWEEGSSTFIYTDAVLPYSCGRFSTIFLYLEKEGCSKRAPFSVMALVRYFCVPIVHQHVCDDENWLVCEIFIINKVLRTP